MCCIDVLLMNIYIIIMQDYCLCINSIVIWMSYAGFESGLNVKTRGEVLEKKKEEQLVYKMCIELK